MILPLAKLGTLALKTFCKPIANRLKKEAGVHPKFRQFIVNVAQANHRITTNIQRRIYGHATNVEIRPLNEEKAVQAATDLIGELFVFSVCTIACYDNFIQPMLSLPFLVLPGSFFKVAVAALIFEVQRSARSEARKEEARKQEIEAVRRRGEDLAKEVEILKQKLSEIDQLARKRGLPGIFSFGHGHVLQDSKPVANS
ncbi:hypothetical protein AXF42_Ash001199 [Apostasia shenzhenica]|uniref:OPA3-like protein n=1 Tax=Apostasia shenzhenica TaxID=1088818 RepID=A0A2I0AUC2_9ASPA|nr:hypothetical protein AXF42_Ash001199 [Apostasia shenzhenica]